MKRAKIKLFKAVFFALAIILLLAAGGIVALIQFYPEEKVRELVIEKAENGLKRKITIGRLEYSLRGLSLQNISLYDGKTEKAPLLFSAEEASLGFSLMELFNRKLSIDYIYFNRLKLSITFDESGTSNIQYILKDLSGKKKDDTSPLFKTAIDKIRLNNAAIAIENPKEKLAPLKGTYTVSALLLLDLKKKKEISITSCSIDLPDKRGRVTPDIRITITPKQVEITGTTGLDNTSLLWTYAWTRNPAGLPYRRVTGKVTGLKLQVFPPGSPMGVKEKATVLIEGRVKATATLTTSPELVHAEGLARVDQQKRRVYLTGVQARMDTSRATLERVLFSFEGRLLDLKASHFSCHIPDIRALFRFVPAKLYGRIEGDFSWQNRKINSKLKLENIGYDYTKKLVRGISTELNIADNVFKKENILALIMGNRARLSVASVDTSLEKIFLNIKAPVFNFPLNRGAQKPGEKASQKRPSFTFNIPVTITGRIDVGSFTYDLMKLNDLAVNYVISGNKITISQWKTSLLEGAVTGRGSVISTTDNAEASLTFHFKGIKIQELGNLHEKLKNRFFGIGTGNGSLSYIIGSGDLLTHMKGMIEFQIARGKIANTGIQNGLGIWLSELKYKLKDLEFNTIYGNVSLNGENYRINSFVFNSDYIRLKIQGIINSQLIARSMDISLEFTGTFIQDLPTPAVRLGLEKYKRGRWFIIPFSADGPITESKNIRRTR